MFDRQFRLGFSGPSYKSNSQVFPEPGHMNNQYPGNNCPAYSESSRLGFSARRLPSAHPKTPQRKECSHKRSCKRRHLPARNAHFPTRNTHLATRCFHAMRRQTKKRLSQQVAKSLRRLGKCVETILVFFRCGCNAVSPRMVGWEETLAVTLSYFVVVAGCSSDNGRNLVAAMLSALMAGCCACRTHVFLAWIFACCRMCVVVAGLASFLAESIPSEGLTWSSHFSRNVPEPVHVVSMSTLGRNRQFIHHVHAYDYVMTRFG